MDALIGNNQLKQSKVSVNVRTNHVRVVSRCSELVLFVHLQLEEDWQVDDILVIQAKLSLQYIPVPVNAALGERSRKEDTLQHCNTFWT